MSDKISSVLDGEITDIEFVLAKLQTRLETFEAEARKTIDDDQAAMLNDLQGSVSAIQQTAKLLEGGKRPYAGLLTFRSTSQHLSPAAVDECTNKMLSKFGALRHSTDTALANTKRINLSYHGLDVEVDELKSELRSVNSKAQSNLNAAEQQLTETEKQVTQGEQKRDQLRQELSSLETKMESEKEDRNVLRVFRTVAWIGSVVFPPVVGVAVGLEIAAADFRRDRDSLQTKISQTQTQRSSLQSQIHTLTQQRRHLNTCVATAQSLLSRADTILATSASTKKLASNALIEYQHLKEATDEFAQWSTKAHDRVDTMGTLCDDEKSLRRMMKRFIEDLAAAQIGSLTHVLAPLRAIEFEA